MEITCLHCKHETQLPIEIEFDYFVCPQCFKGHSKHNGILTENEKLSVQGFGFYIPIGKSVVFGETTYWVSNAVLKNDDYGEGWCEYELRSATGNCKYLTEENGNWTLSEAIEFHKYLGRLEVHYNDRDFALFDKGKYQNKSGVGFFDFKISRDNISYKDFISPPYLLSEETEEQHTVVYYGQHIAAKEIKKLFQLNAIPSKTKIGMAQPFYFDMSKTITTFCFAAIIILISHMYFYNQSSNQLVYSNNIDLAIGNEREMATDVFELKGPIAPLTIYIKTGVDNSWLATDFSLVNQKTGETAYFSKDVEYYHGYEGGESWSEGSSSEDFNICGVSSGQYKITFKPSRDSSDVNNSQMSIDVYWNESSNWNFMTALCSFVAVSFILFMIKNNYEQRRWSDSDYSPYSKEED